MPERGAIYKVAFATSNGFWTILADYQASGPKLRFTKAGNGASGKLPGGTDPVICNRFYDVQYSRQL
jgi:hypothetical protein